MVNTFTMNSDSVQCQRRPSITSSIVCVENEWANEQKYGTDKIINEFRAPTNVENSIKASVPPFNDIEHKSEEVLLATTLTRRQGRANSVMSTTSTITSSFVLAACGLNGRTVRTSSIVPSLDEESFVQVNPYDVESNHNQSRQSSRCLAHCKSSSSPGKNFSVQQENFPQASHITRQLKDDRSVEKFTVTVVPSCHGLHTAYEDNLAGSLLSLCPCELPGNNAGRTTTVIPYSLDGQIREPHDNTPCKPVNVHEMSIDDDTISGQYSLKRDHLTQQVSAYERQQRILQWRFEQQESRKFKPSYNMDQPFLTAARPRPTNLCKNAYRDTSPSSSPCYLRPTNESCAKSSLESNNSSSSPASNDTCDKATTTSSSSLPFWRRLYSYTHVDQTSLTQYIINRSALIDPELDVPGLPILTTLLNSSTDTIYHSYSSANCNVNVSSSSLTAQTPSVPHSFNDTTICRDDGLPACTSIPLHIPFSTLRCESLTCHLPVVKAESDTRVNTFDYSAKPSTELSNIHGNPGNDDQCEDVSTTRSLSTVSLSSSPLNTTTLLRSQKNYQESGVDSTAHLTSDVSGYTFLSQFTMNESVTDEPTSFFSFQGSNHQRLTRLPFHSSPPLRNTFHWSVHSDTDDDDDDDVDVPNFIGSSRISP